MTSMDNGATTEWRPGTAVGRWSTLGPYYAMFPVGFVRRTIGLLCPEGSGVLDPFCGRGTVPYVARVTGRPSLGIDINPVGWVFASVKADPEPDTARLKARIADIAAAVTPSDTLPENDFQKWAWCGDVLGFLRSARRTLSWKTSRTDRTLMAVILIHLHGKIGNAVSNQMRQSKSMGPNYAVRWWSERQSHPPMINPVVYFNAKVDWRYRHGIPAGAECRILLGDSRIELPRVRNTFGLLLTSPPYCDVTNYRVDNWIRLWILGEAPLPSYETSQRYTNRDAYGSLLHGVFSASARVLERDAPIYVRTDSRPFTRNVTARTLNDIWPERRHFMRAELVSRSQTHLFGTSDRKPGETDLLSMCHGVLAPAGFRSVPPEWLDLTAGSPAFPGEREAA